MNNIILIGVDLAKNDFQVYAENKAGKRIHNKRLTRNKFREYLRTTPPCLIGMEACGTAHYWAREAKSLGHEVKLINPRLVKAFVIRNKNDANDAEAIADATKSNKVSSISVKTLPQQHLTTLHRARSQVVRRRTQLINHIRSLLAEYGLITTKGYSALERLLKEVFAGEQANFPCEVIFVFQDLYEEWLQLNKRLKAYDLQVLKAAKENKTAHKLMTMPGVGEITATALVAKVEHVGFFKKAKDFAAFFGLTPKEYSSANTKNMGKISKQGDRYIRMLLIHGARASIRATQNKDKQDSAYHRWIHKTVARIGFNKTAVALANKHARMIWAILRHDRDINLNDAAQYAA